MEPVDEEVKEEEVTEKLLKKLADNDEAAGGEEVPDQTPVPVEGSPA